MLLFLSVLLVYLVYYSLIVFLPQEGLESRVTQLQTRANGRVKIQTQVCLLAKTLHLRL